MTPGEGPTSVEVVESPGRFLIRLGPAESIVAEAELDIGGVDVDLNGRLAVAELFFPQRKLGRFSVPVEACARLEAEHGIFVYHKPDPDVVMVRILSRSPVRAGAAGGRVRVDTQGGLVVLELSGQFA